MTCSYLGTHNLCKKYSDGTRELVVLNSITIRFDQGSCYAIMGVSGSGKSTFMHLLAGIDSPTTGSVVCDDKDLALMTSYEHTLFLRSTVGLVFQNPYLIKELTVLENVMVRGLIRGLAADECSEKAHEILGTVGLCAKAHAHPMTLSGGQQQRVALARALFGRPAFLLADEPTGNLDEKTGRDIIELLLTCQNTWNMGIIVSTHDCYVAHELGTICHLKNGELHHE